MAYRVRADGLVVVHDGREVVIVLALLALWLVSLTPFIILAYGQGRDYERALHADRACVRAAAIRSEQTPR